MTGLDVGFPLTTNRTESHSGAGTHGLYAHSLRNAQKHPHRSSEARLEHPCLSEVRVRAP